MSSDLSYIAEDLRGLAVAIETLHADPVNARMGHDIDRIMASLRQYGQRKPIVVNRAQNNKVEAGNGTLSAAKRLGWTHVAAVFVEDDPMTATGYGIADNRTGDLSTWDVGVLKDLADNLPEDIFTGFEAAELDDLVKAWEAEQPRPTNDAEPQIDKAAELQEKWKVQPGELFEIGAHRLICGDCTDAGVVEKLMGGEKARLIVTSPPYNQQIDQFKPSGMHKEGDWVSKVERLAYSDSMPENEYQEWQKNFLGLCYEVIDNCGSFFYNHKNRYRDKKVVSPLFWLPGKFNLRQEIIWSRPGSVTQNARMFLPSDERIYWMYKGDDFYFDDTTENKSYSTVWNIGLETNKEHAVGFPVELPTRPIKSCSAVGDLVYDPFLGSGTTMVAAQNLGRKCYGVEISPAYCAVILERMVTAFPGLEIVRGEA